jgi:hypothetical protein
MLDTGATGNYMSRRVIRRHNFGTARKLDPYELGMIDGTKNPRMITEKTVGLKMHVEDHCEMISFDVFDSSWDAVLGIPWFTRWNPQINWRTYVVIFPEEGQEVRGKLVFQKGEVLAATDFTFPKEYAQFEDLLKEDLGATALPKHQPWDHRIPLKPGTQPIKEPLRRASEHELKIQKEYIEVNLKKGFIVPSEAPWASALTLAPKKDGSERVCVDYRKLNNATIKDAYPLPLISELQDRTAGAQWFTKYDLRGAYNLIRVAEEDEDKTTFRSRYGSYKYRVMPFGLTNAPGTFQRHLNHVLERYLDDFCIVYLDDILVYSKTLEEHIQHNIKVLEQLKKYHLLVKGEKCAFHQKEVSFLGCIISTEGLRMDPDKTRAIVEWPTPTTVKEVQSFLGMAQYNRKFIKGFSAITTPLSELTRKDQPWEWTDKQEQAFNRLKEAFTTEPVLKHFNPELPIVIETDASDYALGACLTQRHEDGKLHPVAYHSRKMSKPELNYEIHDKELLAIVDACKEWRVYISGAKHEVQIYTDHKNLTCFTTTKELNRRQVRWSELLAEFNLRISYRKGSENGRADALSRRNDYKLVPEDKIRNSILRQEPDGSLVYNRTFAATDALSPLGDEWEKEVRERQRIAGWEGEDFGMDTEEKNGLWRINGLVWIPESLIQKVIERHHDDPIMGHSGVDKTIEKITRCYVFKGLKHHVQEYVRKCDICNKIKHPRHKPYGLLQKMPIPEQPWDSIAFDFITKLPKSRHPVDKTEYDSIFVVNDRFTKMAYFRPFREETDAPTFAHLFIETIYAKHGMPKEIISDRDKLFVSNFWKSFTEQLGTKTKPSTAFHPQTDGQTERTNQTLEQYLRAYVNYGQDNWAALLPLAEFVFNTTKGPMGVTPHFALYGRHPRITGDTIEAKVHAEKAQIRVQEINQLHETLRKELRWLQYRMAISANKKRSEGPDLQEGDMVYLIRRNIKTQRPSTKLDHTKLGPFKIKTKKSRVTFELELPASMGIHPVFHISLLEPCYSPNAKPGPVSTDLETGLPRYEVDRILRDEVRAGVPHYLVRWKGYADTEDTWVPLDDIDRAFVRKYHKEKGPPKAGNGEFIADKILQFRGTVGTDEFGIGKATGHYLVRWLGYGPQHDTWEPTEHLPPELMADYHRRRNQGSPPGPSPHPTQTQRQPRRGRPRRTRETSRPTGRGPPTLAHPADEPHGPPSHSVSQ